MLRYFSSNAIRDHHEIMYLSAAIYLYSNFTEAQDEFPRYIPYEESDDEEFDDEPIHQSDSDDEEFAAEPIREPNQKGLLFSLGARCPDQEWNINDFYQTVPEYRVMSRPELVF
jgi:hypothetical protein